jgi:serine/threonine protein kinase
MNDSTDTNTELQAIQTVSLSEPRHAHVIRVYDFWVQRGSMTRTFIKMERCQGTLEDYISELMRENRYIDPLHLLQIMIHISSGLRHCHDFGVLHRDLKPSNGTITLMGLTPVLFVNESCKCHPSYPGSLKKRWILTDFGFSSIFKSQALILSRDRRGTPVYRAPELAEYTYDSSGHSTPGSVSTKSDIWALGCILYRLATSGKTFAFSGDYAAVAYKQRHDGVELPQLTAEHAPSLQLETMCPERICLLPMWEQINSILGKCLARDPELRPSALELRLRFQKMADAIVQERAKQLISS